MAVNRPVRSWVRAFFFFPDFFFRLDFVRGGWLLLVAPPPWGGLGGGLASRQEFGGRKPPLALFPSLTSISSKLVFSGWTLYRGGWLLLVAPPPWGGLGGGLAFRQELGGTQAPLALFPA